jgi:hypothetical protein
MKELGGTLGTLAWFFALMSLFAIGGANSAVPEIHRFAVDVQHWMTDPQFSDIFGLAQLTPGPNVIVVTLIGYHVAGLAGALVATLAMCGPTCLLGACRRAGGDAGDVRADMPVGFLCRPHLRPLPRRILAGGAGRRPGAGDTWADRGERRRRGESGG